MNLWVRKNKQALDLKEGKIQTIHKGSFERFSGPEFRGYIIFMVAYIAWLLLAMGGIRPDHRLLLIGGSIIYFASEISRKFVLSMLIILVYWIIFDSIRLYPAYNIFPLHIKEPYLLEKALFGIETVQGIITPNEYWEQHRHVALDLYTGFIYLCWIPIPLAFCVYNFIKGERNTQIHYLFTFFMVSQLGLFFQYLYPAAPPWYVQLHGFEEILNTPGNPGALINVDHYLGISLFSGMYDMNANVFAAIPSLHCAFPIILLYFARTRSLTGWTILALVLMVSTWFSAVYTYHHYIVDVILGIMTGALAVSIYHFVIRKTRIFNWLNWYAEKVK